ncbi:hypothetical protein GX48_06520 [Paracoccidioides brasiliensis]|nr:hypothetical protein GX48_06520 [Paracoccidioides brasiliensis]
MDSSIPHSDWNKLYHALDKLDNDESQVEKEFSHKQEEISQLFMKMSCLCKQKKFLKECAGCFLKSDVKSLEELEKLEEEEEKHECVQVGHHCVMDSSIPHSDWNKLYHALDKLDNDESQVEKEFSHKQEEISQLFMKMSCLCKQKKFLKECAGCFLKSDVKSLEELEKLEEEEEKQCETQVAQQQEVEQLLTTIDDFPFELSDSQLTQLNQPLDFISETVEPSALHLPDVQ